MNAVASESTVSTCTESVDRAQLALLLLFVPVFSIILQQYKYYSTPMQHFVRSVYAGLNSIHLSCTQLDGVVALAATAVVLAVIALVIIITIVYTAVAAYLLDVCSKAQQCLTVWQ
jgi:hypothetical protein